MSVVCCYRGKADIEQAALRRLIYEYTLWRMALLLHLSCSYTKLKSCIILKDALYSSS
jgi:hypothetical protein